MDNDQTPVPAKHHLSRRLKILIVVLAFVAGLAIAAVIAVQYAINHAEPMLRARVIQSLSTRFNSRVQLGELDVSLHNGVAVEGKDLTLRSDLYPDLPPQISVAQFSFHTGLLNLFQSPMRVGLVELHGLVIKIPPKGERSAMPKTRKNHGKMKFVIGRIVCDDALLVIMTNDPKKTPLQFKIHALMLTRLGARHPMHFEAHLINPKPVGDISTEGNFGPWNAAKPHDTPVNGTYSFTNADLSTTHGIAGILSSHGKFSGPLDTLIVDGATDTPDFSVDASGHKVDLRTQFHAVVNGTNGNTYLQPVKAQFLHTALTATGEVVRAHGRKGHDIHLNVVIDRGRIEDLLQIGVKTEPPVMTGNVQLNTRFYLPPGKVPVNQKLYLQGAFAVENISFTNPLFQKQIDELSLRSQGKAGEARGLSRHLGPAAKDQNIQARMRGTFLLTNGRLMIPRLVCNVPGAVINLTGTYTLDGRQFDFTGRARMQASVSSMVGGWKGALLKPIDRFFAKPGAGTDVPIKITGTKSNPHFGLNYKKR